MRWGIYWSGERRRTCTEAGDRGGPRSPRALGGHPRRARGEAGSELRAFEELAPEVALLFGG